MESELRNIITKQSYLTSPRLVSGRIVEYDIRSANISCLYERGIIDESEYNRLFNLPKMQREIEIGLMEKEDPKIYTEIQTGIKSAKLSLAEYNNLEADQIIRIANDAVYINTPTDLPNLRFGKKIEFRPKSISNIYLKLNDIIFFLNQGIDGNISVDIKGLGENNIPLHQDYMINGIISTVIIRERASTIDALGYLSELCDNYLRFALPVEYYREFNSFSKYRLKASPFDFQNQSIAFDNIGSNFDLSILDINYNYIILRELWSIMIELYDMRR